MSTRKLALSDVNMFPQYLTQNFLNTLDSQYTVNSCLSDEEIVFWQEKQSELDSDFEVRQIRKAALRLAPIITKTKVVDAETAPILFDGDLPKGHIALTFDDGPHPVNTRIVLKTLKEHGVHCNFFQVGMLTNDFPDVSRSLAQQGHIVASHSMTHPNLAKLPENQAKREIIDGRKAVAAATGIDIPFFRFPFLSRNPALQDFVKANKLATFSCNINSEDYDFKGRHNSDLRSLLKTATAAIEEANSGIMLLHLKRHTALILSDILNYIKVKGYTTVKFVPRQISG